MFVALVVVMIDSVLSTPGIWFSSEGCNAPTLDGAYMGGQNLEGSNLELQINGKPLEEFNTIGFDFGTEYEMALQTKDDEWMQFVVHISAGTQDAAMAMLECGGKVALFAMDFNIADFKWTAPLEEEVGNEDIIMTTSYAPAYTNAYIQAFTIKSKASIKHDL